MNIQLKITGLVLLSTLLTAPPLLTSAEPGAKAPEADLLVKVNFPEEWPAHSIPGQLNAAWHMENAAAEPQRYDLFVRDSFVGRLAAVLAETGYTGRLLLIDRADESFRGKPILIVTLKRWAVTPAGRFDCYFNARLATTMGDTGLGSHEYSDAKLTHEFDRSRDIGIEKATDRALAGFVTELGKSGQLSLLPSHG